MPPTTAGILVFAAICLFCLYKVLVWIVPVQYEAFESRIIHETAFMIATTGLGREEMYTKPGSVRSSLTKKIEMREAELSSLHINEGSYIRNYLLKRKLINKYGRTRKILVPKIERALYNYVLYDRQYIYKNMEGDIQTFGISPKQFFELKKTVQGDMVGVYVIYNADRQMYYVGQAKRLYFRVWQHFTGHGNGDVYADYKYGNRFVIRFVALNGSGYEDLDLLEKDLIKYYNAFTTGYNKTIGNSSKQTKVW